MATKASVPVIVMSGYLTVRDEIMPLGFSFLQKPFNLADLSDLINRLIRSEPPSA